MLLRASDLPEGDDEDSWNARLAASDDLARLLYLREYESELRESTRLSVSSFPSDVNEQPTRSPVIRKESMAANKKNLKPLLLFIN